jgi:pyruvate dehydrogenase E2 component (dihydrolipoamide acetyltransferase)
MALEFKLPDIGEGVAEGEIVKWLVKVGDTVKEHQSIVEVMTDKATVEVPAPAAGKITALKAKEGDTVPVGSVIFVLETNAGAQGASSSTPPARDANAKTGASTPPSRDANAQRPSAAAPASNAQRSASATNGPAAARAPAPSGASSAPRATAPSKENAPAASNTSSTQRAAASPASSASSAQGATIEFKLPDVGEGVAEGEIVKWLVKVGDQVKEHQSIVEVMTDKATVEVPAPAAGTIVALRAKEGEVVPVGQVIFSLATAGAGSAPARTSGMQAPPSRTNDAGREPARASDAQGGSTRADQSASTRAGSSSPATTRSSESRELVGAANASTANVAAARAPSERAPALHGASDGKILAVPSARRLARDMNVDLAQVPGSGRNGVVRRADVEAFANSMQAPAEHEVSETRGGRGDVETGTSRAAGDARTAPARSAQPPTHFVPGEREKRIPFRGVRRKIAEAMVRSKFTAPHFTVVEEVDVTELVKLREQAKAIGAESNVKVTFMPFIMKATALALAKYPMLNAHLDESAQELVRYQYVNLGIAMDTDNGLIVPVMKEVQSKGILEIASELAELAERTRAGKVKPEELKGSTFSITNAGNIGGTLATPIINFPDVAILGVHRIMKKPGVIETPEGDKIAVRQYMNFSCSVDHRLADGADGARFLVYLKKLLENPGLLAL